MRPENPAKTFMRRYRALLARQASLERAIGEAWERLTSITAPLGGERVSGGGPRDRIGEGVAGIIDAQAMLMESKAKVDAALADILRAIDAVKDETQKAVLTLRYVEGLDWISIQEAIGYERTQTLVIHGRALWQVREWLEKSADENGHPNVL